ncbi:MAG: type II toxin-antitoxin system VapC family toxin [Parafilimonas terrae]|nr:type II toxin-antitoxin system VapC family toxin [Parafilimonas terrae]
MSGRYLLDTNIISEIVRQGGASVVLSVIARIGEDSVCTSVIVASEMRYGVARKGSQRLHEAVERALRNIEVVPYGSDCAHSYGTVRATLERAGRAIGALDMLIAAHALSLGATLVTDNRHEFERVADLRVVNWLDPADR